MIEKHYEFSGIFRFNHWVRAAAMVVLIITGFYIADPFIIPAVSSAPDNFMNALWRYWHLVFGFVLIATTLFKTYLFLFDVHSRKERVSFKDFVNPKVWIQQIKYYLLIGTHPENEGIYNPLQFVAYFAIFIALFVISITGLILHMHCYHDGLGGAIFDILRPLEVMMGGLAAVREIHHVCMWVFIIFIPVHVYMAVFNSVFGQSGAMDSIFSGYSWQKKAKTQEKE